MSTETTRATFPTFPRTFGEPGPNLTVEAQRGLIQNSLADLKKAYDKHNRWLTGCTDHSYGGELPNVRTMPGKDAKHRMYGSAGHILTCARWDRDAHRPRSMDDLAALIIAVESILRRGRHES